MFTLLLTALLLLQSGLGLDRVQVRGGMFYSTSDGRTLMFRGINSVIKKPPWYDPKLQDPVRQKQLQDWGFNSVRLGMMWSGLQPTQINVNETYAAMIKETVDGLAKHGIYTYLDMHQDVLTGKADYWGIPAWVGKKMAKPRHSYPWPLKDASGYSTWACGYFTEEISNAFHQLYTNKAGIADLFAQFWKEVARRFKDTTAVLGYELLNEPWTGDIYKDLSLLLPGNAGRYLLEPFYNRASDAIRSVDNDTVIFWEPVTYAYLAHIDLNPVLESVLTAFLRTQPVSILFPIIRKACGELAEDVSPPSEKQKGIVDKMLHFLTQAMFSFKNIVKERKHPSVLGPGFTAPPGGVEYLNRTALSWHYYCWALGSESNDKDFNPLLRAGCNDYFGPRVFNTVNQRAAELGGSATFLTEFGLCVPRASLSNSTGTIECNFVMDQADKHLQSWSYWDTCEGGVFWDAQGHPVLDTVKVFSRPYPPATAGHPLHLHFDPETREFEYKFKPDLTIRKPTEIFVPELTYTQGYQVQVPQGVSWQAAADGQHKILVTVHGTLDTVTVHISPL